MTEKVCSRENNLSSTEIGGGRDYQVRDSEVLLYFRQQIFERQTAPDGRGKKTRKQHKTNKGIEIIKFANGM